MSPQEKLPILPGWYWQIYFAASVLASLFLLISYVQKPHHPELALIFICFYPGTAAWGIWAYFMSVVLPELRPILSFLEGSYELGVWLLRIIAIAFPLAILLGAAFSVAYVSFS